jgi:acyl-coenzyme A thioesterase PaaI-like protein
MSPGQGEWLVARGKVIKNGRTLKVCQSEIFNANGEEESLCAIATVTMMELQNRSGYEKKRE